MTHLIATLRYAETESTEDQNRANYNFLFNLRPKCSLSELPSPALVSPPDPVSHLPRFIPPFAPLISVYFPVSIGSKALLPRSVASLSRSPSTLTAFTPRSFSSKPRLSSSRRRGD